METPVGLAEAALDVIDESAIVARLLEDEGEILHAYQDHLDFWTIGVGRLIDKRKGGGITKEESRYLLRNDIARKTGECRSRFEWFDALDDVRKGVIICMAFQLGTEGVSNFKLMIRAITNKDWVAAHLQMLESTWAKQTPARAKRMANIMLKGQWI